MADLQLIYAPARHLYCTVFMTGVCQRGFRIMNVTLLTVALPLMLGYSLFVAISGRLNPVLWPLIREDRPSWALGVWIGLAVSIVAFMNARAINVMPAERPAVDLFLPAVIVLTCLIIPALGLFALYRYRIISAEKTKSSSRFDWSLRGKWS